MPLDCVECGRRAVRVAIGAEERGGDAQREQRRWREEEEREKVETERIVSGVPRQARGRRLPGKFWETRRAGMHVAVLFLGL